MAWDRYRLDFYCAQARLAVEVDGDSHRRKAAADAARDAFFRKLGIETLRVSAVDVERDCGVVVARIHRRCVERAGAVPPVEPPARGFLARLLRRARSVEAAPLAPPDYTGRRRGGRFVCARCRTEHSPLDRSPRTMSCCATCAG